MTTDSPHHSTGANSDVLLIRGRSCFSIPDMIGGADGRNYRIGERINSGGNAVVHECFEKISGELFAIKFQVELRDRRRERFVQEVELLRRLNDPHIISYVTHGDIEGTMASNSAKFGRGYGRGKPRKVSIPFVVLPRASQSLAEYIAGGESIPTATYLGQFIGLAGALVKVNDLALHRDIKPENVLIVGETWAISDFGLCDLVVGGRDLSREEERIGPIFWMSPEALNSQLGCDDQICQASDVFQMASVFWYVSCGRHPTGIVIRDDWRGPGELYPVMEKALMHSSDRRFSSSEEFRGALVHALGLD